MAAELKRLRRENEVLRQEREILKRATALFSPRREVDEVPPHRRGEEGLPGRAPVQVLDVSPRGYFAWKNRPASTRQREDLVLLAHVRSAFTLSHETYGSPRMTHELREQGLAAGRRRVARLMRENGLKARQPRRFRRTTDSGHAFPIAPNHLDQDFTAAGPDRKWGSDISYIWTREGWLYWRWSSTCTLDGSWLGGGRPSSQGTRADRAAASPRRPAARIRSAPSFRPRQSG